jgi:hypothetical protein
MEKYKVTYSIEYLPKLSGDWSKLNNPLLGFPENQLLNIKHYGVFKK